MNERANLHDYEKLLASIGPSQTVLVIRLIGDVPFVLISSVILALLLWFGIFFPLNIAAYAPWLTAILPIVFIVRFLQVQKKWMKARLRVTTERILLDYKSSIIVRPVVPPTAAMPQSKSFRSRTYSLVTIKWSQYQESSLPSANVIEKLFGAQPLAIRYGSADGQMTALFPSIPFAKDLKHYLDKVDSAVRHNQVDALKPFVLKHSGQRD